MQPGGDPLILCFVDFVSPAHAATAMDALQGDFYLSCNLLQVLGILVYVSLPINIVSTFGHVALKNISEELLFLKYLYA